MGLLIVSCGSGLLAAVTVTVVNLFHDVVCLVVDFFHPLYHIPHAIDQWITLHNEAVDRRDAPGIEMPETPNTKEIHERN